MSGKRMSRRAFLRRAAAFAGMAAVGSLAVTCGATPTPEVIEKEVTKIVEVPEKAETMTLRVQTLGGVRGEKAYKFARMYETLKPNITLKNEDLAWGDTQLKQELLYGTGDLWDICYGHTTYANVGAHKGWYAPIDDLLAADPNAVPGYPEDFYEAFIEFSKWEGKTYGIIDAMGPGYVTYVYNRHIFEQMGVDRPPSEVGGMTVWELQEMARKLTSTDKGIFGLTTVAVNESTVTTYSRCWGRPEYGPDGDTRGWIISPDGKTFNLENNEFLETWYKDWYLPLLNEGVLPKAEEQIEGGLFIGERQGIQQYHPGAPRRIKLGTEGKWEYFLEDYFMMPRGPDGRVGSAAEGQNWYVGGLTKYPLEALRVIGFFTAPEAGLFEILEAESGYTGRKSVFTNPKVVEYSPVYQDTHDWMVTGDFEAGATPWNLRFAESNDIFRNLWGPLLQGEVTWEVQAALIQEQQDAIFAEPMI